MIIKELQTYQNEKIIKFFFFFNQLYSLMNSSKEARLKRIPIYSIESALLLDQTQDSFSYI